MPSGSGAGVAEDAGLPEEGGVGEVEATAVPEGGIDEPTWGFLRPPFRKKTASRPAPATAPSAPTPASTPPGRRHQGAPKRPEAMLVRMRGPRSLGAAVTGRPPSS